MKLTQKQRKYLGRPRPILFSSIVATLCAPWLLLLVASGYLRQQQTQVDTQAHRFFSAIPTHPSNLSAQQFDTLGAELGLSVNAAYSTPIKVNAAANVAFRQIEPTLNQFIEAQANKISGPLDPLPPELQIYLHHHQAAITQIRSHILNAPAPQWNMEIEPMTDINYPAPGFFNVRNVQKLLLLKTIEAHHQAKPEEIRATLEATWRLNQAIAQRSDLSSQVSVAVISAQQAGILRHLHNVPAYWQARLIEQSQHQPIMKGVRFEAWLRYEITKASWIPDVVPPQTANIVEKLQAALINRLSLQTYFKLLSVDNTKTVHQALDQLEKINVCTTSQLQAETMLSTFPTAAWNQADAVPATVIAKRWQTAGNRTLALELSQQILATKQQRQTLGEWPTTLPPKASQTCPTEHWTYQRNGDQITLSFSKPLLSPSVIPLTYRETDTNEIDTSEIDAKEIDAKEIDAKEIDAKEIDAKEIDAKEIDTSDTQTD